MHGVGQKLTHGVGNIRSAGQLAKHLMDCSMEHSILVADKAAVQSGTITQDEFDEKKAALMSRI